MGPALLDHDLLAGLLVGGAEDAALVRAADGAAQEVPVAGQDAAWGRLAGLLLLGLGEGVGRCPGRGFEPRLATVGDPGAVWRGHDGLVDAVRGEPQLADEAAEAKVRQAAGPVRAVGQDARPGQAAGGLVQGAGQVREAVVVRRVDGEELARRSAVGVPSGEPRDLAGRGGRRRRAPRVLPTSPGPPTHRSLTTVKVNLDRW